MNARTHYTALLAALIMGVAGSSQAAPSTPAAESREVPAPPQGEGSVLTLESAIQLALTKGHLVRIEALGVPLSRSALLEAWGDFDPQLVAFYGESLDELPLALDTESGMPTQYLGERRERSSLTVEGSTPWGMQYSLGYRATRLNNEGTTLSSEDGTSAWAGFSLRQSLLRGFGSAPVTRVRVARTNLRMSEWEFRQVLSDIIENTVHACAELEFAEARERIARKSLEMARSLRKDNARRQELGAMSENDVLSADARVALREDSLAQATRGLDAARNALRALISDKGPDLVTQEPVRFLSMALPVGRTFDGAADLRHALENRPDYQLSLLGIHRAELQRGEALNRRLPKLDLVGSLGYNGLSEDRSGARDQLRDHSWSSWTLGVEVRMPLGSFAERGAHRAARLRVRRAEYSAEKLAQDIALEIANATDQFRVALSRVESAARARELNERALEAEFKKLRAGTGSTFSVLYQQDQLNGAELNEAYARADLIRAAAWHDRATGRLLQAHNVEPLK